MSERAKRIDAKHRFSLRVEYPIHADIMALCFRHNISLNAMHNEMILFCLKNQTFLQFLNRTYVPSTKHGHFVYFREGGQK